MTTSFYSEIPAVGQPDPENRLAMWCNSLVQESSGVRDAWMTDLDLCLNLYLYGREYPDPTRNTVNKIQAIVHTFVDLALKQPPVTSLVPSCVGEDPEWYLLDPVQGVDITQPIPAAMLTAAGPDGLPLIPDAARVAISNDLVTEFEQSIFDVQAERARVNQFYRENVWLTNIFGWQLGLYEWDDDAKKHLLSNPPLKQWFPDPTVPDVKDMAYLAFDWPMDANLAKQKYPKLPEAIDDLSSQSIRMATSALVYSSVYTDPVYQRAMVTVRTVWIRNQRCVLTPEQAVQGDHVAPRQFPIVQPAADDPGVVSRAVDAFKGLLGMGPEVPDDPPPPPGSLPMRNALVHPKTGEEMDPSHSAWPTRMCLRRVTLIGDVVVEDIEVETWDIPVTHNVNIPIPNRPYGQGEPVRVASLQKALNSLQDAAVRHAQWFKGPSGVGDVGVRDLLPEGFKDAHMNPDTIWWIDSQVMAATGGKPIQYFEPPELPATVMTVKHDTESALDVTSGVVPVLQGDASAQWSGAAMENQQAAATSSASFKSLRFEEVVWRTSRLMLHSQQTRMTDEDYLKINNKYPPHVVAAIRRRSKAMDWDIKVEVGSGAGQAKAQKDQRAMNLFKLGLIDKETACDMLGLDYKLIQQRMNTQQPPMPAAGQPMPVAGPNQSPAPSPTFAS